MLVKLLSIVALGASAVLSLDVPTRRELSINPPESVLVQRSALQPELQVAARYLTNAERLRDGLPLNPPRRRSPTEHHQPRPSSPPRFEVRGYIQVKDDQNNILGFIGNTFNSFGEYGVTGDDDQRLLVAFDRRDARSGAADIKAVNGPDSDMPFLGGITGFSSNSPNVGPDSSNYNYIGGTAQTPSNSPPAAGANSFQKATLISEQIESAIYTWTPHSDEITPQWINSDSSKPTTYIGYTQGILLMTGDKTAFTNTFGPTVWVTFKFISA